MKMRLSAIEAKQAALLVEVQELKDELAVRPFQ